MSRSAVTYFTWFTTLGGHLGGQLVYFTIDAPKTRRVVTSATGVVARLPEFWPQADGQSNTRGLWRTGGEVGGCVVSRRAGHGRSVGDGESRSDK